MIDIPKDVLKKIGNSIEAGPLEKVEEKDRNSCYGCTGSCSTTCVGCCVLCCVGTCADGGCSANCGGPNLDDVLAWLDSEKKACQKTDERDTEKK